MSGSVTLVGAGPGDPGLLTVRGREALEAADLVLYDRLGTAGLLHLCRDGAELVNAGKAPGRVAMTQEQINAALVEGAEAGRAVVRLKGGDPFVFGRGGEEVETLAARGIPVEVVPGITSAIAAPAYAGIPVTHRGVSTSFTVVTGHEDPAKGVEQTDWNALARVPGTLVLLMAMGRIEAIRDALIAGGRPPDQPAACIQRGTTSAHRSVRATLRDLPQSIADAGLGSPAIVIVGDVAGLDPSWAWFEKRPLLGQTVVVTRARAQASALSERLRALGAEVIELPTIRITPLPDDADIDAACSDLDRYGMVVFASANGVDQMFHRLAKRALDARAFRRETTVVAAGPATAERLRRHGIHPDVVAERFVAEGVVEALDDRDLSGLRVLVPQATAARPTLADALRTRGATVDALALYSADSEPVDPATLDRAMDADYLTFTAGSTVRSFASMLDGGVAAPPEGPRVISIGPVTSAAATDAGLTVHAEAERHDIPGLIDALLADSAEDPGGSSS